MSSATEAVSPATTKPSENTVVAGRAGALLRRGGLTVVDQMVASATTFISGVFIGRVSETEFGYYTLGFTLMTFMMTLQSALVSTPYTVYYPRVEKEEKAQFTGSVLLHQLIFAAVVALGVLLAGAITRGSGSNPAMAAMLLGLGSGIGALLLRDFIRQVCYAQLAVRKVLTFDVCVAIGQIALLAILFQSNHLSAVTSFLALGGVCALCAIGWFVSNRKTIQIGVSRAKADFVRNWSSAKWLFASGLIWSISMNLYAWLVAGFHGAASAGVWAAALGVVTAINPLMIGVQNFVGPHIMHAYADGGMSKLRVVVLRAAFGYAGLLTLFSLGMLILGDYLVTLIYGARYQGNGFLVALLSFNLAFNAASFAFSRGLFALERANIDFKVNLVALVSMIACGVWLAKLYGPVGAAAGQVIANGATSCVRVAAFYATVRTPRSAESVV